MEGLQNHKNRAMQMPYNGLWTAQDAQDAQDAQKPLYTRVKIIGNGGWGTVYKLKRATDGLEFAGKASKAIKELRIEAANLKLLNHKHIVKFEDWYDDPDGLELPLLVMELCTAGSLQSWIHEYPEKLGRQASLQIVGQIANAVEYMHAKGLFHSDIKPRNILIRQWQPLDVVLGDCADIKPVRYREKPMGTRGFWSPHLARFNKHSGRADDIWALGVTLLAIMGHLPTVLQTGGRSAWSKYPQQCIDHVATLHSLNPGHDHVELLRRMLHENAVQRATATQCVAISGRLLTKYEAETKAMSEEEISKRIGFELKTPEYFEPPQFW